MPSDAMAFEILNSDPRVHLLALGDAVGAVYDRDTHLSRLRGQQSDPGALVDTFGDRLCNPSKVEVFEIADIETLGLRGYLQHAYDIPPEAFAADASDLDELKGMVIVLSPGSMAAGKMQLPVGLIHVGSFAPIGADMTPRAMSRAEVGAVKFAPNTKDPAGPAPRWLLFALVVKALFVMGIILWLLS